jgi:hypothetical protein
MLVYEGPFMIRAHKIRMNPTPAQANHFARAAGTSRNARELGACGMESAVCSRRETDGVEAKARSSTRFGGSTSPGPGR